MTADRLYWAFLVCLLTPSMAIAGQDRPASVEGTVTARDTGAPIAGAHVELRVGASTSLAPASVVLLREPLGGGQSVTVSSKVVTTTNDGRFRFDAVTPGEYRLYATRPNGYVPGEYGQRGATGEGTSFTIRPGTPMTEITLVMTPTASISGRVIDTGGEPSGYAHVQALRAIYRDGHRMLTVAQLVQADEQGQFRLFWLPPGEYYVCARPLDLRRSSEMMYIPPPSRFGNYEQQKRPTMTVVNSSRQLANGETAEGQHVPICYPLTPDLTKAVPVSVQAGQQMAGLEIDVSDSLMRIHRIRGRVINGETGQPVRTSVELIPRDPPAILAIPSAETNADGAFDIGGGLPGASFVVAGQGDGLQLVSINGADIDNAIVRVWPPRELQGQIRIAGRTASGADSGVRGIAVTMRRDPFINGLPGGPQSLPTFSFSANGDRVSRQGAENISSAEGLFTLSGVQPGTYVLNLVLREDMYIESIRLGLRDVLNDGLTLDGPSPQARLEVVLQTDGGQIEGRVTGARNEPASNVTVVAVPQSNRHRRDLYRVGRTDGAGAFRLRGLAPGGYELFAWDVVEAGAWYDAEFIKQEEGSGQRVQVTDGSRSSVTLGALTPSR